MKIFCVMGEDYYVLPDSTILRSGNPLFLPEWDNDFRIYTALAVRIDRLGKSIAPKFAHRYYNEMSKAGVMIGCERLAELRKAGRPWTTAVSFDRSCLLGEFIPKEEMLDADFARVDEVISMLSADNTMKTGDMILMFSSEDGIATRRDTVFSTYNGEKKLLEIRIK